MSSGRMRGRNELFAEVLLKVSPGSFEAAKTSAILGVLLDLRDQNEKIIELLAGPTGATARREPAR